MNEKLSVQRSSNLVNEISINVEDSSIRKYEPESTNTLNFGNSGLQPIFASEGPHNKFFKIGGGDVITFDSLYGKDCTTDIDKYGYSALIARRLIEGGADVNVCRLVDTATAKSSKFYIFLCIEYSLSGSDVVLGGTSQVLKRQRVDNTDGDGYSALTSTAVKDSDGDDSVDSGDTAITQQTVHLIQSVISGYTTLDNDIRVTKSSETGYFKAKIKNGTLYSDSDNTSGTTKVVCFPILTGSVSELGSVTNDYQILIERNYDEDKYTTDGIRYQITIYKKYTNNGILEKKQINLGDDSFIFTFYPFGKISANSEISDYFTYELNKIKGKNNKFPIDMVCHDNPIKKYLEIIKNTIGASNDGFDNTPSLADAYKIDFLFGRNIESNKYAGYVIDGRSSKSILIEPKGGVDGNELSSVENTRKSKMESLLISFFKGEIISDISDTDVVSGNFTSDANFPLPVKKVMAQEFTKLRENVLVFLDLGIFKSGSTTEYISNPAEAFVIYDAIKNSLSTYGWRIRVIANNGVGTLNNGLSVQVPGTYDYAYTYAKRVADKSNKFPILAGIDALINRDFTPAFYFTNTLSSEDKKKAIDRKLIFIQKFGENEDELAYFSDSSQYTQSNSKLSSARNANIVTFIMGYIRKLLIPYLYSEVDLTDELEEIDQKINDEFSRNVDIYLPKIVSTSLKLIQTTRDKTRNNVKVSLNVSFGEIIEKFEVIINITNKE